MTKRKKQGVDWHGWAWKPSGEWHDRNLFHWAEPRRPWTRPSENGKWVRVKFVEVTPKRAR